MKKITKIPDDVYQALVNADLKETEPMENLECWSMDPDCPEGILEEYKRRNELKRIIAYYAPTYAEDD